MRLREPLLTAIYAATGAGLLLNASVWLRHLSSGLPYDYSDGLIASMRLSDLYKPLSSPPYVLTYYPPLGYLLHAVLPDRLVSGEMVALVSLFAASLMVFLLAKDVLNVPREWAVVGSLVLLSAGYLSSYGTFLIPVWPEAALDLLSAWLFAKRRLALSASSITLACFTRQTALLPFVGMLVYMVVKRDKAGLAWFGVAGAGIACITGVLDYVTQGRYILEVFLIQAKAPASPHLFYDVIFLFVCVLPLMTLSFKTAIAKPTILTAMLVASIGDVAGLAKAGSGPYYLALPIACAACLAAPALYAVSRSPRQVRTVLTLISLWMVTMSVATAGLVAAPTTGDIGALPLGPILADNPNVYYIHGQPVYAELSMMWATGWNDSALVQVVRSGYFASIVFQANGSIFCDYPSLLSSIAASYHTERISSGDVVAVLGKGPLTYSCPKEQTIV